MLNWYLGKNLIVLCSALFITLSFQVSELQGVEYPIPKTMMWSLKSTTNTVYILGSIHAFHKKYYPLSPVIENAYQKCDHIVFETKINPLEITLESAKNIKNVEYQSGASLEDNITPRTLSLLKRRLKRYNISYSRVKRFKPWLVGSVLSGIEFIRSGFEHQLGIDYHFLRKADRHNKQKYFLESISFQVNLISSSSPQVQDQFLHHQLLYNDVLDVKLHDLAQAWVTGNTYRLEKLTIEALKKYPELYDLLLVKRNRDWVSKIESIMKKKYDFFVVVGCGHLIGADSLLTMLENRGHTIVRH
ncbi:TraB/GumN family protein [candidate division CSSED10-310 bacterium]|uniref:TraB/GumN family protein n=1 Tax=candidate division CSSED10-310 bacterium TaxID=2855610 RepID=A0ABV6Z136_UNCC1